MSRSRSRKIYLAPANSGALFQRHKHHCINETGGLVLRIDLGKMPSLMTAVCDGMEYELGERSERR